MWLGIMCADYRVMHSQSPPRPSDHSDQPSNGQTRAVNLEKRPDQNLLLPSEDFRRVRVRVEYGGQQEKEEGASMPTRTRTTEITF